MSELGTGDSSGQELRTSKGELPTLKRVIGWAETWSLEIPTKEEITADEKQDRSSPHLEIPPIV
jgi:hypothetical protein